MKTAIKMFQVFGSIWNERQGVRQNGRAVASVGAGGALAPPVFGQSVNSILTRGGKLCPSQYYQPPRIFRPCDGPVMFVIYSSAYGLNEPCFIIFQVLLTENAVNVLMANLLANVKKAGATKFHHAPVRLKPIQFQFKTAKTNNQI